MPITTLATIADLDALDEPLCIVDCRFSLLEPELGTQQYQQGHIPGAVYAHLDNNLSGDVVFNRSGRHPLPEVDDFVRTVRHWGINKNTQVIAYDDSGGVFAARLWWLLRWVGHASVAVLDGGIRAWQSAGHKLTNDLPDPTASRFNTREPLNTAVSTQQVLDQKQWLLIDAREGARFRGDAEPIDPVAGHIPNAYNVPFQRHLDDTQNFLSSDALRQLYQPVIGTNSIDEVVCYCGSGVTAAHSILAVTHAGLGTPKLYAGSWSEWIKDTERPIAASRTINV